MKKILHIIGGLDRGGAESYIMNSLRNIDRKKYKFGILTFLAPRDGDKYVYEDELRELGVEIIRIADNRFRKPHKFINDVAKVVSEGKYDIVHSHIDFMSALSLAGARKGGAKQRIAHSHNTNNTKINSPAKRALCATLRKKLNHEATIRLACGEDAGRFLYGARQRFTVIHNGINLQDFRFNANVRQKMRAQYDITEDATVLLNIGRFEAQKNQEQLIDIFADYWRKHKDSKLVIVGEGSLKQALEDKIASERMGNEVLLLPAQDGVAKLYSMSDVFLLPSLFEGVPTVGIEAQVNGLKCLFSDKVPAETKLLDSAEFLSLEENWRDKIVPTPVKNRGDAVKEAKIQEYDIKNTVKTLEKVYDKE